MSEPLALEAPLDSTGPGRPGDSVRLSLDGLSVTPLLSVLSAKTKHTPTLTEIHCAYRSSNLHRGQANSPPCAPAIPPDMRVRIQRFGRLRSAGKPRDSQPIVIAGKMLGHSPRAHNSRYTVIPCFHCSKLEGSQVVAQPLVRLLAPPCGVALSGTRQALPG